MSDSRAAAIFNFARRSNPPVAPHFRQFVTFRSKYRSRSTKVTFMAQMRGEAGDENELDYDDKQTNKEPGRIRGNRRNPIYLRRHANAGRALLALKRGLAGQPGRDPSDSTGTRREEDCLTKVLAGASEYRQGSFQ
ncbi:MAG: hypothetical protein NT159_06605 [Proteobacteria bacterium]|nr:hypothetical protein [Pseudomonadota bacterium]